MMASERSTTKKKSLLLWEQILGRGLALSGKVSLRDWHLC